MKMLTILFVTAAVSCVYGKGSTQLGKQVHRPKLGNCTIFLKVKNRKSGAYDRILVLKHCGSKEWMSPGGEIDGTDNGHQPKYCDATFEEALVREFLEETGLPEFPTVKNAVFYDFGGRNGSSPHTRVYVAETDDRMSDFKYQPGEAEAHTFAQISFLIQKTPTVKWKGNPENCRFKGRSFSLLDPNQASRYSVNNAGPFQSDGSQQNTMALSKFAKARLYTDKGGNKVVRKGQSVPHGMKSYRSPKTAKSPDGKTPDGSRTTHNPVGPGTSGSNADGGTSGWVIAFWVILALVIIGAVVGFLSYSRKKDNYGEPDVDDVEL